MIVLTCRTLPEEKRGKEVCSYKSQRSEIFNSCDLLSVVENLGVIRCELLDSYHNTALKRFIILNPPNWGTFPIQTGVWMHVTILRIC